MKRGLIIFLIIITGYSGFSQLIFGQNRKNQQAKQSSELDINYSSPKEYIIADIEVRGIQFLDNNALITLSGLRVGDKIKIPSDDISDAIKKIWNQGIIGNVSIFASKVEGNSIWLVIELTERPRLMRYEFTGVTKTHQSELEDKVELVRGKILTDVVIKNTELTVKKYMEGKGFLNAKVNVIQKMDTAVRNSAILQINVDRGKKVRIKDINIVGNTEFSDVKIRSKLGKTGEIPKFSLPSTILRGTLKLLNPINLAHFLTHKDTATKEEFYDQLSHSVKLSFLKSARYVPTQYKEDKMGLINYMNSKGYRDAEIVRDSVYSVGPRHLAMDIVMEEGNQYYFRDISWSGNFIYDDKTLDNILGIKNGDVYDLELITKKLNYDPTGIDISSLYMDDGYLFFRVDPVEVGIENDSIDIEMRIFEGPQATINEVTISGNDKTSDHVIFRELRTLPGDKFNRSELIRTQRELSQLGYFNPEKVNPNPVPNMATETVDIEWQLEEQPSDQIELSGGWGGAFGFVGTLGVNFTNFSLREALSLKKFPPMGDGQRLSLRAQANGRTFQSYSFSFQEPWLGGRKPNSFGISYTYSVQRRLNTRTNETFGSLEVQGVTVSLGRRVNWPDDFFSINNSLAYLRYDLFNFGQRLGFSTGTANSIVFNTTIGRYSTDHPMYPQRGSDVSLSVGLTPPYSLFNDKDYDNIPNEEKYEWVEYHKWNFDARYYMRIIPKLVLAPRVHFGFIGSYSDGAPVGPFERFVLGGDGLTGQNFILGNDVIGLRGYPNPNTNAAGPTSLTPYDAENQILGGTAFVKYVMELRYPVSLSPAATVYLLTFMEAGNSWNNRKNFNPYNLYRSAGVGVRIFMPAFGLLGLDWGYGFDTIPGQTSASGAQFHFSIGQQIR